MCEPEIITEEENVPWFDLWLIVSFYDLIIRNWSVSVRRQMINCKWPERRSSPKWGQQWGLILLPRDMAVECSTILFRESKVRHLWKMVRLTIEIFITTNHRNFFLINTCLLIQRSFGGFLFLFLFFLGPHFLTPSYTLFKMPIALAVWQVKTRFS